MFKFLRNQMRWIMITIALAFLLSTFLMYDTRSGSRSSTPSGTSENGNILDYAVAVINGRNLMRSEMDRMVHDYVQRSNIRELSSTDIPFLYQATLDDWVFRLELSREVEARNIDVSEEEITIQVNNMADSYTTREAFQQAIQRSGIKMEDLRNDIKRQIITERTISSAIGAPTISEDTLVEFYDVMKGLLFSKPKGYMFDLVEVSVDKTAGELREKIAADLDNWREIVSQDDYSQDVVRISTEPLFFSEIALSSDSKLSFMVDLGVGEVGPVSEVSSNDFMIVIKRENMEESFTPYDEVSLDIRMMHEQQQQRAAYDSFRDALMARAIVEIKDASLFPATESPEVENESADEGLTVSPDIEESTGMQDDDLSADRQAQAPEIAPEAVTDAQDDAAPVTPEAITNAQDDAAPEIAPEAVTNAQDDAAPEIAPEAVTNAQDDATPVAPEAVTPEDAAPEITPEAVTDAPNETQIEANESVDEAKDSVPVDLPGEAELEIPDIEVETP